MEKEEKVEDDLMFKEMVKEEIEENKRRKDQDKLKLDRELDGLDLV